MKKKPDKIIKTSERKPLEARRTDKGPEPERLKIDGNWVKAVGSALRKPKPTEGWPS